MTAKSQPCTTADEAIAYLYELRLFGTKLGLDNPRRLAAALGNPQDDLAFIHVAGTNGKGSVCALLESIYRTAGYRVGLFTSPHLIDFRERLQVQRNPIPAADLVRHVERARSAIQTLSHDHQPTFFEVVVILGLLHFQASECDLVIWETGMGGRLDATNIVTPAASLITNIALDHQKWLGDTLLEIAGEKAGIIKPNIPVVLGAHQSEVVELFARTASDRHSPLHWVTPEQSASQTEGLSIGIPGPHQRHNAALAMKAVELLQADFPVSISARDQGLAEAHWSGRLQVFRQDSAVIVVDGSHNEPSIRALVDYLDESWPDVRPDFLLGVLEDKGIDQWLPYLVERANHVYLTPVQSGRTLTTKELAARIETLSPSARLTEAPDFTQAFEEARAQSSFLVICGSIYLVGEALAALNHQPSDPSSIALNDWGGPL